MRVLAAYESSGRVRKAFADLGHDAWSCDLKPAEDGSRFHIEGDALDAIWGGIWDLVLAFPPCTHVAVSGNRWWAGTDERWRAERYFMRLLEAPVRQLAIENPVGSICRLVKPTQWIQPWMFGDGYTKRTGLWLKFLPPLKPTRVVPGRAPLIHHMPPSATRQADRSRTPLGLARAMARQWGGRTK